MDGKVSSGLRIASVIVIFFGLICAIFYRISEAEEIKPGRLLQNICVTVTSWALSRGLCIVGIILALVSLVTWLLGY
jgi:hypothetical protein